MNNSDGRVALITGAAGKRGIGHAIAIRLAQNGINVAVSDLNLHGIRYTGDDNLEGWQGLKSVVEEMKALGRKSLAIEADITSGQQVEEMVDRCIIEFGRIDILVNNSGILGPKKPALEVSEEEWCQVLRVNMMGTYLVAKTVAKRMIKQGKGGKIINIASLSGKSYFGGDLGPYTVSKFAVVGLTQVLAQELARYKIQVNAICPGFIATEMGTGTNIRKEVRNGMSIEEATAKAYASVLPQIPMGRVGQPEDVAKVVAFLASMDSDYMTGQSINVSGGLLMSH